MGSMHPICIILPINSGRAGIIAAPRGKLTFEEFHRLFQYIRAQDYNGASRARYLGRDRWTLNTAARQDLAAPTHFFEACSALKNRPAKKSFGLIQSSKGSLSRYPLFGLSIIRRKFHSDFKSPFARLYCLLCNTERVKKH